LANVAELVVKVVTDTSKAKGLDETGAKSSKFASGLATASKVAAGALVMVGGAAIAAGKAAAEDAASQAQLANALVNNAGASKQAIAATEDWISAQSAATGIADDELRPALGDLVRATGNVAAAQGLLTTAMDVSAATGKPLSAVTTALAKAYAGNVGALSRVVPGLDQAKVKAGDFAGVLEELRQKTDGAAAAAAGTAAGKFKRFQVALGETQEAAGAALLPILEKLSGVLVKVGNWAQEHGTLFTVIAAGIAILATAVIALNVALTIYNTITAITAIVSTAAWAAVLGPITLVIIAVLAVVAVVVILWKKSETFRKIVTGAWNAIKVAAAATGAFLMAVWNKVAAGARVVGNVVRAVGNGIQSAWNAMGRGIVSAWRAVWNAVIAVARAFAATVRGVWDTVRSGASSAADWVKSKWSGVWNALRGAVGNVGAVLSAPFNAVKGAIDGVISAIQSLIGWLSRIHVPKISLPHIPGVSSLGVSGAGAGGGVSTYAAPSARGLGAASVRTVTGGGGPTIVIQGALDPEAVARQINRIMAGHDRRVNGRAAR
jgi:hypothetical protein